MNRNQIFINKKQEEFDALPNEPNVGDFLKLPYGLWTRFTDIDGPSRLQTGNGSFFMGSGYLDFSGSFHTGVAREQVVLTDEVKEGSVWFFDKERPGSAKGYEATIRLRVYELLPGADTSGIPPVVEYEREAYLKTIDQVTHISGNDQVYSLPVPEIQICGNHYHSSFFERITQIIGAVTFKDYIGGFKFQPEKHEQLTALMIHLSNFKWTYYNNGTFRNVFILSAK